MAEEQRPERPGPERLLRRRAHSRQASFLELFFDLAFIVSFALLSARLVEHLTWRNAGQTAILLAAIWWIWIATAWSTDWYDPNQPLIRGLVLGVMVAGLLMSAAIPHAYGSFGLVFAGTYALIHLGRAALLLPALRGHPIQRRSAVVAIWFGLSAIPWIVGGILTGPMRVVFWVVAILIDYAVASQGWPVPWLGRVSPAQIRVVGEHLSERYRQIFIVALGEVILVSGLTYTREGLGVLRMLAFVVVFFNAVLMLWMYFVPVSGWLGGAIERNQPRGGVYAAYCHAIMIAGVVLTAVGAEIMIMHPVGEARTSWSLAIVGGAALFLVGRILMGLLVYAHPVWRSGGAVVLILASTPGLVRLPPLAVGAVVHVILLGLVLVYLYAGGSHVDKREAERQRDERVRQEERAEMDPPAPG
ncbi:low temperature requirement protein A [Plantactinospora sp. WMMC1484]|uniref:low temperature requirement protein A n=1 Tax=Plantactinospora sp. WMMC1484 TaxID=3404122 RepID=UPI003BF5290E